MDTANSETNNNVYGFDIEAVPLTTFIPDAKLLCASIAQEFAITYVKDHEQKGSINNEHNLTMLAIIGSILADSHNTISGHNLQFDISGWEAHYRRQLYEGGNSKEDSSKHVRSINADIFDTMIAHYLVDETPGMGKNSLSDVAAKYLGKDGLIKLDINHKEIPYTTIDMLVFYNQVDAMLVYRLYEPLMNELEDRDLTTLYSYLMDILKILISMQIHGVKLDVEYIDKHRLEVENMIEETHGKLTNLFGDINFNSWQQLGKVLYEELELPILHKTNTGNPSTSQDAIIKLKANQLVPKEAKEGLELLSDYRKLNKIHSTYLLPLKEEHLGYDGRIHTSYFLGKGYDQGFKFGTVSGRTSSSNPNLQNIPNTVDVQDFTVNVRKAFIPGDGYKFYKADYSQLEMRIAAYLSKDKTMLNVFKEGIDIHTYSLTGVYEESYDYIIEKLDKGSKKWKRRRLLIKNFNFALIYGASAWKLQQMLLKQLEIDMDIHEVKDIVRKWNRLYPTFSEFRYIVHEIIREYGYVETETGRRRYFFSPEKRHLVSKKDMAQYFREGLNDIVQSFGSDICVIGLSFLAPELEKIGCRPLLLVHDSVDGEMDKHITKEKFNLLCRDCMITKPKEILANEFHLDTRNLHLEIDTSTHLDAWG